MTSSAISTARASDPAALKPAAGGFGSFFSFLGHQKRTGCREEKQNQQEGACHAGDV
jgi:hypothetical protein